METIKATDFYNAWIKAVYEHEDEFRKNWQDKIWFTPFILNENYGILSKIADTLDLDFYSRNYYSLDGVLYHPVDQVKDTVNKEFNLTDIRVAFEHENVFNKRLYTEVAHLLITNCDLRVLVTYPDCELGYEPTDKVMNYLLEVIAGSRRGAQISDDESFLIIFGYENNFDWEGYVYKTEGWKKIS